MNDTHIYDPLKLYKNELKSKHHDNVEKYFNDLVLKSGVDIELNKETVKKLNKNQKHKDNISKAIRNYFTLRILLILAIVVLPLILISQFTNKDFDYNLVSIIIIIAEIAGVVLSFILIFMYINPKIKMLKNNVSELSKIIDDLRKEASKQMAPLNSLFEDNISIQLFKETLPLINFDNYFDSKRLEYLTKRFDLNDTPNLNRSTLFVKSGDINGNPFYIANDLVHQMGTKVYTGAITISWTAYVTVNGKRQAQRRTQVLTASVSRPHPYYNEQSYVVYGNEAAPNLTFDRTDSDAENMDQKQIDRHVRKEEKKLQKKARKQVKKGGSFTTLAHSEFEVLFGATNRNNEVEFRLLFTPLAQKQLLELMKDKNVGYGDNFDFTKYKKINIVYPEHLNLINLEMGANYYKSYSYEESRDRFINYNNNYFKAVYFAFAPVLAIPLYQQQKPHEYIYEDLYKGYASFYEHENIVNKLGEANFSHPEAKTRNILKTSIVKSENNVDQILVSAYSYKTVNRTELVPRIGGDGKTHLVPVFWTEFVPVMMESLVDINIDEEEKEMTHQDKVRAFVERLKDHNNLSEKDLKKIGTFITYIHKK